MVSALLFDPSAKVNKTHKDSLVVCTSIYFRFSQHSLAINKQNAFCAWFVFLQKLSKSVASCLAKPSPDQINPLENCSGDVVRGSRGDHKCWNKISIYCNPSKSHCAIQSKQNGMWAKPHCHPKCQSAAMVKQIYSQISHKNSWWQIDEGDAEEPFNKMDTRINQHPLKLLN